RIDVRPRLRVWNPHEHTPDSSREQDSVRLPNSLQDICALRPGRRHRPFPTCSPRELPYPGLVHMLELYEPSAIAPDQVVQPEQPDVIEVESANGVRAPDLTKWIVVDRKTRAPCDEA